ncbi:DUF2934 domain-containing protein [Rhizobium sp. CC-YZS058]|uniref:DUF2934 domain-containing protein n=1 Tax=Rhizobium sp. CC-YZS058 TaxID=3042153 RepID=UPI002B05DD42|nr:DUF2934 domain-containing protein [Rhizobium sp. CC-YZS058]MEA3536467.1 DUF2934 domain-containing protein [Rhizobium sp. CC-YZS058]
MRRFPRGWILLFRQRGTNMLRQGSKLVRAGRQREHVMAKADDDRIRKRAHEIWEEEGRPEGRHSEHWEQAVRDVTGASSGSKGAGKTKADSTAAPQAKQSKTAAAAKPASEKSASSKSAAPKSTTPKSTTPKSTASKSAASKPTAEKAATDTAATAKSAKSKAEDAGQKPVAAKADQTMVKAPARRTPKAK